MLGISVISVGGSYYYYGVPVVISVGGSYYYYGVPVVISVGGSCCYQYLIIIGVSC